jgi:peptidoglycan/LPS O-acetylase OafA/YrhL
MAPNTFRVVLTIEFLVALVAIFETWSMAGGQSHLDLMPWYAKLGYSVGLALTIVMGSSAAASHEKAWNAKTLACMLLAVVILLGMAGTTYYYHVHENDDQGSGDDSVTRLIAPDGEMRG